MRADNWPRFTVRRTARTIVLAAFAIGLAAIAPAQTQTTPHAPQPAKHRKVRATAKQSQPVPQATVAPVAPPAPNWPVNSQPGHASISWDSRNLRIDASNSSLLQILTDVAGATGTKIEGAPTDQRVFGTYGPGSPRDVLTQLLQGSNNNIVMIGDNGQGLPRQVLLTARGSGNAASPAAGRPASQPQPQQDDDYADDTPAPEPEPPPAAPAQPEGARPTPDPQEIQRQQLMQQQQQGQQPGTQPNL